MSEVLNGESKAVSPQIQEASFSYSWYPTQCEIGSSASGEVRLSETVSTATGHHDSYHILKAENEEEEMVVVEQVAPPAQHISRPDRVSGSKFSEQQSRVLMHAWKELYDRKQHTPSNINDWKEISHRVNLAPGSYKTVQQVKKKFKNLRDRYRAAKAKNKKRGVDITKINSLYAEFEKVYGKEEDLISARQARHGFNENINTKSANNSLAQTGVAPEIRDGGIATSISYITTPVSAMQNRTSRPLNMSLPVTETFVNNHSLHHENRFKIGAPGQATDTRNESHQKLMMPPQADLQLVNAVRELQQQQIIMQRELTKNMKRTEERILSEVATQIKESEDRFRQQIANALTQLGNLIRIT